MTALNNLKGHIVRDGKVVYSEELEPKLQFAVIEMYEPFYEKGNYSSSSKLWLEACITTGEKHTWSNGVQSLDETQEQEIVLLTENFRELRHLKTSQGFRVWESVMAEGKTEKTKYRTIKWCVEVPKEALSKFFSLLPEY